MTVSDHPCAWVLFQRCSHLWNIVLQNDIKHNNFLSQKLFDYEIKEEKLIKEVLSYLRSKRRSGFG